MRNIILVSLLALSFAITGCKSDSDILASYTGGEITRGEFYEWIKGRHLSKKVVLKSKAKQKAKLKQIALEKLYVAEAKKNNFQKSEDFMKVEELLKDSFLANSYRQEMRKEVSFKEQAAEVRIVKLRVKNSKIVNNKRQKLTDKELKDALVKKKEDAVKIIAELSKGGDFAALAKKHSNDYSKKKGGMIGYVTTGMRDKLFMDAVFKLKAGEFTKEPLEIRNALYIIKVEKKAELSNENVADVIKDEKQAKRIENRLKANAARSLETKMLEAADVTNNIEKANLKNPEAVLFKIGEETYLVKNLNELFDFINLKRTGAGRKKIEADDKRMRAHASRLFNQKLMARKAKTTGLDKKPEVLSEWNLFFDRALSTNYKNDVILKGVKVEDKEVRDEYEKMKKRMIERNKKAKGKNKKPVQTFKQMEERVRFMIYNRKKSVKARGYDKQLLSKNSYVVFEDELEEKK